ncbi:MAG: efflux RND transporter periplasmic adaptor subunit [Caldithrix sp.]|nr:efflux RND transporter periplasmic adaptor subunit [Caldithrix sp.]
MSKIKKRIFKIGVPVLVVSIVVALLSMNGKSDETVAVETTQVNKQSIVETVTATGRIQPKTQVKISADVAAKITRLDVKEGQWVEKGQFLVQLDRERFLAAVESAEANLRAAEANANLVHENVIKVEKDYQRTKELFDKKLEPQATLDQYLAAYKVEKARYQSNLEQVDQAKAALKQARDDLSKTTIHAPISGTISRLNKEEGEIALGSQFQEDVIMIISNLTGMEALVDVDENDIVSVKLNDKATIEVDALPDITFQGTVSEIANSAKLSATGSVDQKTEFEVKIAVDQPDPKLRPGMTASADIVTETRDSALVVPIQSVAVKTPEQLKSKTQENDETEDTAFTPDEDGFVSVIFVVKDGIVHASQVTTGIQSEKHIEILDGVREGDEVVSGNYRAISQLLRNGSPVTITETEDAKIAAN